MISRCSENLAAEVALATEQLHEIVFPSRGPLLELDWIKNSADHLHESHGASVTYPAGGQHGWRNDKSQGSPSDLDIFMGARKPSKQHDEIKWNGNPSRMGMETFEYRDYMDPFLQFLANKTYKPYNPHITPI